MAKSNFSKVEKSLEDGLIKMTARHLKETSPSKNPKKEEKFKEDQIVAELSSLKQDLMLIKKYDQNMYKNLGFSLKDLKKILSNPTALTHEHYQKICEIKVKVKDLKKEIRTQKKTEPNDTLIQKERIRHINKRFNVQEKWLPLQ